jgi:iron complex outermembrane receptor protein
VSRALDLQTAAPGITISRSGITDSFNIRGIGLASASPQVTNGVATYIDGVFQTRSCRTASFTTWRARKCCAAAGHALGREFHRWRGLSHHAAPAAGQAGRICHANYGNYNNVGVNGAINVPVGDNFAIRASGLFNRHDAWFKDIGPAKNQPERLNEIDGRVQALYKSGGFRQT